MPKTSATLQGLILTILMAAVHAFDLDFDEGQLTEIVSSVLLVVGFIHTYYGRYRQGDITWYGKKK